MGAQLLVVGATGLVGTEVLRLASVDQRVGTVSALVRRPLPVVLPKVMAWEAVNGDLSSGLRSERVDAVICCLGTTMRNVGGDQRKFIHVDHDLVLAVGRWAKASGAARFCVVSAMGADSTSRFFYNRVKGDMEQELIDLRLPNLHIFQPSILTGPRQEGRLGERIGIAVMKVLSPLLLGNWADYKPMPHDVLAKALLNVALGSASASLRSRYQDIRSAAIA